MCLRYFRNGTCTYSLIKNIITIAGHRFRVVQVVGRGEEEVLKHHQQEAEPQEPGAARRHVCGGTEVIPCSEVG